MDAEPAQPWQAYQQHHHGRQRKPERHDQRRAHVRVNGSLTGNETCPPDCRCEQTQPVRNPLHSLPVFLAHNASPLFPPAASLRFGLFLPIISSLRSMRKRRHIPGGLPVKQSFALKIKQKKFVRTIRAAVLTNSFT